MRLHLRRPAEVDEIGARIVADVTISPQIGAATAGILIDRSRVCEIGFEICEAPSRQCCWENVEALRHGSSRARLPRDGGCRPTTVAATGAVWLSRSTTTVCFSIVTGCVAPDGTIQNKHSDVIAQVSMGYASSRSSGVALGIWQGRPGIGETKGMDFTLESI